MKPTLELVSDDGLAQPPTTEEIVSAGLLITLAAGSLFIVCAAMGWALKKVVDSGLDRAWDRDYWQY
jgi:hypothetical protein